jgi:mannitol/fructose-specific phosphotransferase system IIA component (Ntr-type)
METRSEPYELFSEILDPVCAATGVTVEDKDSALVAAVDLLANGGKVPDKVRLLEEIRARERLSSTVSEGVAVPHALCEPDSADRHGRPSSHPPGGLRGAGRGPVDLVFLMAGPRGATANHLKILSKLARLLHDDTFRIAARQAQNGAALARLLFERD